MPQMALAYRLDAISQGPKNSGIPGPNPLQLPHVMYIHASKTLCTGVYKSQVHKQLFSKIKIIKKSHNRRNQGFSCYFCLIREGSGSVPRNKIHIYGSGTKQDRRKPLLYCNNYQSFTCLTLLFQKLPPTPPPVSLYFQPWVPWVQQQGIQLQERGKAVQPSPLSSHQTQVSQYRQFIC